MKAWRLNELTGLPGLKLEQADDPTPGPHDVVVKVGAIGLNSSELQLMEGFWTSHGVPPRLPHIPGIEAAGEIVAVGAEVTQDRLGERVTANYWWPCGECSECLAGWENTCLRAGRLGRFTEGTYAELVRLPANCAIKIGDTTSYAEAVALTVAAGTAWHMLMVHGELSAGQTVLITGGASAIGTAAIEVAKLSSARIIATAGHDWKLEAMKSLGAELVINHTEEPDFREKVMAFTNGTGVDIAYEAVGDHTFDAALASLRPRGRLIVGGYMGGVHSKIDLAAIIQNEARIYGSRSWSRATLIKVLELAARGDLRAIIDSRWAFDKLPDAMQKIIDRKVCGKVVVEI